MASSTAFWSVFRRSRIPMFVLDNDAVYVDANEAACTAAGLTREDFVGRPVGFGSERERLHDIARMWDAFMRTGSLVLPYQYRSQERTVRLNIVCTAHTPERDQHLSICWRHPEPRREGLSPREREIAQLLATGLSGEAIARRLALSPETVRTHIRNAMQRVGAKTRAHLIAKALEAGAISLDAQSGCRR